MNGPTLYGRAILGLGPLDRLTVVKSHYSNGWFIVPPEGIDGPDTDGGVLTFAEAIAYATAQPARHDA